MADMNILQGAVFHDDNEDPDMVEIHETEEESPTNLPQGKMKWSKKSKPAAHKVCLVYLIILYYYFASHYLYIYTHTYIFCQQRLCSISKQNYRTVHDEI